jgi:RecB family endonuclease NucS
MNELQYSKAERISIKKWYSEKWLQDKIEEDPSILGLGDLTIVERERRQSTGGRIDFLLYDPETQTMYETEVMLGATDESHIIRTIEYWDIERRRYPNKDHKAVIVAEDITSRFFNVITLMNRSIPIIAVQLHAIKMQKQIDPLFGWRFGSLRIARR